MKLFKFKRKGTGLDLTNKRDVIYMYIKKNLDNGIDLEKIRNDLEEGKGDGNYTSEDIEDAIELFNEDKKKQFLEEKQKEITERLKQLPRKQRKKAEKLYNMYLQGKILKPNKDIDNKELMLKGSS